MIAATADVARLPLTGQLLTALMAHYRKPGTPRDGGVLLREPQAPNSQRRCDLVWIGMAASRGSGIDAHEIKISRADWLRELDQPAKAEAWWPYCSRFWVVAPHGIVGDGELPAGWGLMEPPRTGRRFKVIVPAATKAPDLTVGLMVELLRRADNERLGEIEGLRNKHGRELYDLEEKMRREAAERGLDHRTRKRLELLQAVEDAIGVRLDDFGYGGTRTPLRSMSPAELAAVLTDSQPLITAMRIADATARTRERMRDSVRAYLKELDRE